MEIYTAIVRATRQGHTAVCLENGLVTLAPSEEQALEKLQTALASLEQAHESAEMDQGKPLAVKELHEFLTMDDGDPFEQSFQLHTIRAGAAQEA